MPNDFDKTQGYSGGVSLWGSNWNKARVDEAIAETRKSIKKFIAEKFLKNVLFTRDKVEFDLSPNQLGLVFWSYRSNGHIGVKTDHLIILEI